MTKTGHSLTMLLRTRTLLFALVVMVTIPSLFPQVGYAQTLSQQSGNIVLVSPTKEGSALECIYNYVRQGVSTQEAFEICGRSDSEIPDDPNDISSGFGIGSGSSSGSSGTTVGSVSCSNSGANPQISTIIRISPEVDAAAKKVAEAQETYDLAKSILDDFVENGPTSEEDWQTALKDFVQAAQELKAAEDAYKEAYNNYLNEQNSSDPETGEEQNSSDPETGEEQNSSDPETEDVCQQAHAFLAQCNADGWKSFGCQEVLNRMQGCDAMVTDPMPGEEACAGESEPDPEEVERVATLVCSMEVNPSDPDQDPCAAIEVDAKVLRGVAVFEEGRGNFRPACGSLVALTSEDQCVREGTHPSVVVAQFGPKSLEEAMRIAQEKIGGGGWVIPMLGPGAPAPGTGPQPETGETGPNPDLP